MSKIAYKTAKDLADLKKIQDSAIRSAKTMRSNIQIALVATTIHLVQHRDYTLASRLVDGLGDGVNGAAVVEWLKKYAGLTVGDIMVMVDGKEVKRQGFTGLVDDHSNVVRGTFDEAKDTMWWELKKQNPYKGFDINASLRSVLAAAKKAQQKVADGEVSAEDVNLDNVDDSILKQVLALVNFEPLVLGDASNDNAAAESNAA